VSDAIVGANGKIIPPGISFEQAVRAGYTGRILMPGYLEWLRTLPCHTCGAPPRSQPSHINAYKGQGTKSPDPLAIPEDAACNQNYDTQPPDIPGREHTALFYLLRAIFEGRLVWKNL
jgi:hypothetical protein